MMSAEGTERLMQLLRDIAGQMVERRSVADYRVFDEELEHLQNSLTLAARLLAAAVEERSGGNLTVRRLHPDSTLPTLAVDVVANMVMIENTSGRLAALVEEHVLRLVSGDVRYVIAHISNEKRPDIIRCFLRREV